MATIYRFIVEQKTSGGGQGRKSSDEAPTKSAAKKFLQVKKVVLSITEN